MASWINSPYKFVRSIYLDRKDSATYANYMTHHLAITMQAKNMQLLTEIAKSIEDCECHVLNMYSTDLGNEHASALFVTGNWRHIDKLEEKIKALQSKQEIYYCRTAEKLYDSPTLIYDIEATAMNNSHVVHDLVRFFAGEKLKVTNMKAHAYRAHHTGTAMFHANLSIEVPDDIYIPDLRERFIIYADELNLDVTFDPVQQ